MSDSHAAFLREIEERLEKAQLGPRIDELHKCFTRIDLVLNDEGSLDFSAPQLRLRLFNLRARAQILIFRLEGELSSLKSAVADCRKACSLLQSDADSLLRQETEKGLAMSLIELGQASNNTDLLTEAFEILSAMLAEVSLTECSSEWHNSIIAYCSVRSMLGSFKGDLGLVADAVGDLIVLQKNRNLDERARRQTVQMKYAWTFNIVNGRRDIEGFRNLIKEIEEALNEEAVDPVICLTILTNSGMELSRLTQEFETIESTIQQLHQLCGLLKSRRNFRRLFEALHLLAQSYRVAGDLNPESVDTYYMKAITSANDALEIVDLDADFDDARVVRVLADRAGYYHSLGRNLADMDYFERALSDYRTALSRIIPHQSPWLYSTVSLGVFSACFGLERWNEAIEAFEDCEKAGLISALDASVSSQYHIQRASEMAGYYDYLASCHLSCGSYSGAVEAIERGRGQQLKLSFAPSESLLDSLGKEDLQELQDALSDWELLRRSGNVKDCERAWRTYANLLRRHEYEMMIPILSFQEILLRMPSKSILVYFFKASSRLEMLILTEGDGEIHRLSVDGEAYFAIEELLSGEKSLKINSWQEAYRAFAHPDSQDIPEEQLFKKWEGSVSIAMERMGHHMMQVLHDFLEEKRGRKHQQIILCLPGQFAALPVANSILDEGITFSESWEVSIVPNAALMRKSTEVHVGASKSLLLVTSGEDRNFGTDANLPFASREVAKLRGRLDDHDLIVLSGRDATIEETIGGLRTAYSVHMACHGSYDWKRPERSSIQLPSREKLEIGRMRPSSVFKIRARLVFLSCCESGISGQAIPPDEFVGLLPSVVHATDR